MYYIKNHLDLKINDILEIDIYRDTIILIIYHYFLQIIKNIIYFFDMYYINIPKIIIKK